MEKFLIDMQVQTSEVSACGQVKAEDGVRMIHSAGYQGMMITDHFHKQYFENLNLESWEKKIDRYLGRVSQGESGRSASREWKICWEWNFAIMRRTMIF